MSASLAGSLFAALSLSAVLYHAHKRHIVTAIDIVLLAVSLYVYALWTAMSPMDAYNNDHPAHLQYLAYLYKNSALPHPTHGALYYHPPLYYIAATAFWRVADALSLAAPLQFVRYLSVFSMCMFVFVGMQIIKRVTTNNYVYAVLVLMLILWPANVAHAARISNDIWIYPLFACVLYCLMRWQEIAQALWLRRALLASAVALAVKTNGLLLLGIAALYCAWSLKTGQVTLRALCNRPFWMLVLPVLLVAVLSNQGRIFYYRLTAHTNQEYIVGNLPDKKLQGRQALNNSLYNLVAIEPLRFVRHPFYSYTDDRNGRQLFMHTLAKTLLFTAWDWRSHYLGRCLSAICIFILALGIPGGLWSAYKGNRLARLMLLFMAVHVGAILAMRLYWPSVSMGEARYVHGIVLVVLAWYAQTITNIQAKTPFLYTLALSAGMMFVMWSLALVAIQMGIIRVWNTMM